MKQVVRKGLKEIIVDEFPEPVLKPHHVLIRSHYSLISAGTETASIHRDPLAKEIAENPSHLRKIWEVAKKTGPVPTLREVLAKFSEYASLGYSGAGVVAEVHPTVKDLRVGDRVAFGGEGTGHGETVSVGRNLVAKVPDSVPLDRACFTTLGAIAMNAVRTAEIQLGDTVAVIGLGLVGQLICQLARLQGAVVIATDLDAGRVDLAQRLGAPHALPTDSSLGGAVREITGARGADCVVIAAAAKSSGPSLQGLEICRDRGRLVIVGAVGMDFPWEPMYLKEVCVLMSRAYGPGSYDPEYEKRGLDYPASYVRWTENRNMKEFLRLLVTGQVSLEPLITHRYRLEDAPSAYDTIMDASLVSLAVVLEYPDATPESGVHEPKRKLAVRTGTCRHGDLRIALVGAGNLARWTHLPNVQRIRGASIRAICSESPVRGKSYALRFGADYCCSDYQEVLDDPDVDLVLVTTRNQHHAPQALAALRAGKHVFVEKPMALTEQECRELCAAAEESGRHLTVGFNRRYAPFYVEQKRQLKSRGGPAVLSCRVNSPGIAGDYWMADPAIGGAILGEACHFVDLMYWLLDSEPVSVYADCLPIDKKEPVGSNNVTATFRFADGSVGSLTYCTVGHAKAPAREIVEVFLPGVTAVSEDFKRYGILGGRRRFRSKVWPEKGYAQQLEDFIQSVRQGDPPAIGVRDGARATIGCLRILDSATTHTCCAIDLDSVLRTPGIP